MRAQNRFEQRCASYAIPSTTLVDIQQLTSKKVYEALIAMKTKEPQSAKVKFTKLFPDENLDWRERISGAYFLRM